MARFRVEAALAWVDRRRFIQGAVLSMSSIVVWLGTRIRSAAPERPRTAFKLSSTLGGVSTTMRSAPVARARASASRQSSSSAEMTGTGGRLGTAARARSRRSTRLLMFPVCRGRPRPRACSLRAETRMLRLSEDFPQPPFKLSEEQWVTRQSPNWFPYPNSGKPLRRASRTFTGKTTPDNFEICSGIPVSR